MKQYYGHRPIKQIDVDAYTVKYVCETCGKTVKVFKSVMSIKLMRSYTKIMMDKIMCPSLFEKLLQSKR